MPNSDFPGALRALSEAGVEFVVVGGLAAVLNGAPVNTFDLDIVPARSEQNVARLLLVLGAHNALYRTQPGRQFKPTASHLLSPGHHTLITTFGPIDVLGTIGRGLSYEDLLPHIVRMEIGGGVEVQVLNLTTIITIKEELAGEKDIAVLPVLKRTLEEQKRKEHLA